MFFLRAVRVFHLPEHLARQFGALSAAFVSMLIDGAMVQGAGFIGHVFQCPESLPLNGNATLALFAVEFTFVADQTAV